MKKIFLVALFQLAILVGFTVSTASAGIYISGNLGAVLQNDADFSDHGSKGKFTFDTGGMVDFAVGTSIGSAARIEAEIGYRKNDNDKMKGSDYSVDLDGDTTTVSYMGNVYYDFKYSGRVTPFIGGGLGYANVEYNIKRADGYDVSGGKDDDNVFAYQLMFGGSFAATEQLNIDLQYRYFGTADPDIYDTDLEYHTHNIMLGLRYSF